MANIFDKAYSNEKLMDQAFTRQDREDEGRC